MDGRQALTPGMTLDLSTQTGMVRYTINREIGRGGSCIVYDASYTDNLGIRKLVRVKECYPYALRISREADQSLTADARDASAFLAAKERMTAAYRRNHELFMRSSLTNRVANTWDLYKANGTIYIVSVYLNGCTFADHQGETMHDCISLMLGTAKALQGIHAAGYLYLDLKPDNILTIEGSNDLVQLFDFDSMVSFAELSEAAKTSVPGTLRTSFTKGYAPIEQQTVNLKQIGRHTDIYSLGAVLFHALWHRTPNAFDCELHASYDFASMVYPHTQFQDRLFRALTVFFHRTLASYYADRYRDAGEAVLQLQEILALSDEASPWVRSVIVQEAPVFYGREDELQELQRFISANEQHTVSVYGMGGIGKSTLVRRYYSRHADRWDARVWLYDQGSITDALVDDAQVQINTVARSRDETAEEYLQRKLQVLGRIAKSQRIFLVIDNFTPDHVDQLQPLSQLGLTILLISRERLPEGMFPDMRIGEMEEGALSEMFAHYSRCDLSREENDRSFRSILAAIESHTLLTELIARQVDRSFLDLQEAEEMVAGAGLRELPEEKIDYVRDQTAVRGTLMRILDRLVEIDRFAQEEKLCLKLLSLFDMPGIEADLFRWMAELPSLDFVNELETAGWLKRDQKRLYLHPVMQEYVRAWAWEESMVRAADRMMQKLYDRIRPDRERHDEGRQFPEDYAGLYRLLKAAEQLLSHTQWVSEASQYLLFRVLMDAPVDQDTSVLFRMLDLLKDPRCLDSDTVLRLYETAAYYRARLYGTDEAIALLGEMKGYLRSHPSAYYLSAYHRAMAVILNNAGLDTELAMRHEAQAIAAARLSAHPGAKKQLAACLLNRARTLMSLGQDQETVRKLIAEAEPLVMRYAAPMEYERYSYACNAAMCFAMDGEMEKAQEELETADQIVYASPDSDLSVAEHLIEETAPIRMEMGQFEEAEDAVRRAIDLCDRHSDALRYRETAFDACCFLGRIYAMHERYIRAEEAFHEAERRLPGTYFEFRLPLCPEEIRARAEEERNAGR